MALTQRLSQFAVIHDEGSPTVGIQKGCERACVLCQAFAMFFLVGLCRRQRRADNIADAFREPSLKSDIDGQNGENSHGDRR